MRSTLLAGLSLILCCCTQVNYTRYVGQQQEWAFATGAAVQRQFGLPVYYGPPDRPYRVLGWIRVENARSKARGLKYAVAEATRRGADAVILLNNAATPVAPAQDREPTARVIAIKFLPPPPQPVPVAPRR
jgi:hypothetical protein